MCKDHETLMAKLDIYIRLQNVVLAALLIKLLGDIMK